MAMPMALTLRDVQAFGGTEDDLKLLEGVDSDNASDLEFNETDQQSLSHEEIQGFIRSVGISKHNESKASASRDQSTSKRGEEKPRGKVQERAKRKEKERQHDDSLKDETVSGVRSRDRKSSVQAAVSFDEDEEKQLLSISASDHEKLLVGLDTSDVWFQQSASQEPAFPVRIEVLTHLASVGAQLMRNEVQLYEELRERKKGRGDVRWLRTVLSSGTLSDKMAALTLRIQESPLHTLSSLDSLLAMATKKGKRESIMAVDSLKQLWVSDLLPEDRKLKSLKQRPLNQLVENGPSVQTRDRRLLLWYFEDQLKEKYGNFVSVLQTLSHDSVANVREKVVGHIFDLLYQRPEQEQALLAQLVNKMGDPIRRVASKTVLFLLKLLTHHVNMKMIVAREIEIILHRPNISPKAQYYGICCLNQFVIGPRDETLAAKMVEIYFTFFKVYVKQGQLDAKMLGALLTGVNRAFPFLKGEIPSLEDHLHSLFKVVHVGPIATGIQSLMLLYQVMESNRAVSGRFYQALYAKLMDPALKHSNRQAMFLNVLFKSLKSDPVLNRVKAFLKRILQVCAFHSPPFVCGCIFVVSEVLKHKPALWSFILQPEASDEEHFHDVHEGEEGISLDNGAVAAVAAGAKEQRLYEMSQRNPLYCGAEETCLWELERLTCHFHPSVQVFSRKIAVGEYVEYKSDPLQDFTLMKFLERFVFKNPKLKEGDHGGSLMQRTSKLRRNTRSEVPVNSAQFTALDASKVRDDEIFIHKYFRQKLVDDKSKKSTKRKKEKEEEKVEEKVEEEEERDENQELYLEGEMDFAGELERQVKTQRLSKKRKYSSGDDEEGGPDSSDEGSDEEFNYDAMGVDDLEDDSAAGEPTEAEVERMLLENLSSDDDDEMESGGKPPSKRRKKQAAMKGGPSTSLFAAADEFSHILQESGDGQNREAKQLKWEEKQHARGRGFQRGKMWRSGGGSGYRDGARGRGERYFQGDKKWKGDETTQGKRTGSAGGRKGNKGDETTRGKRTGGAGGRKGDMKWKGDEATRGKRTGGAGGRKGDMKWKGDEATRGKRTGSAGGRKGDMKWKGDEATQGKRTGGYKDRGGGPAKGRKNFQGEKKWKGGERTSGQGKGTGGGRKPRRGKVGGAKGGQKRGKGRTKR